MFLNIKQENPANLNFSFYCLSNLQMIVLALYEEYTRSIIHMFDKLHYMGAG